MKLGGNNLSTLGLSLTLYPLRKHQLLVCNLGRLPPARGASS